MLENKSRRRRTMKEYKKLADAQIGDNFTRPLLIDSIKTEIASNGNPFLKIAVTDGETMQGIVLFDTTIETLAAQGIKADILADIDLMVESYRGNKSFKIVSMKPTDDPDADIKDYIKLPPVDIDLMYNEIIEKIKGAVQTFDGKYEPLADLTVSILKKYEEGYKRSSAAISMHHNLRGGLLYHSYRMVLAAEALCSVYTSLDKELLICGAAIHDIGKLWEYNTSEAGNAEFTPSGVLFGHLYMGASLIKQFTAGHNYDPEKVQMLIHLILSHHGQREWGAVTLPAIPEAIMLHNIDDIDAKMYMCESNYEHMDGGEMTEKRVFGLDTNLYKPQYMN